MKNLICCAAVATAAASTYGQNPAPEGDPVLTSVRTPYILDPGKTWADLSFHAFGGYEKLLYTNVWVAYGLAPGWQLDLRGSFAGDGSVSGPASETDTFRVPTGETIRFGGSDGELLANYRLPLEVPITLRAGFAYVGTPAQNHPLAGVLGASASYSFEKNFSVLVEPKVVFLDDNSLLGLGLGLSYRVTNAVSVFGEWTPLLSGDNAVDTTTGTRSRCDLYGFGVRFNQPGSPISVDLGITNSVGLTTGTSMTPSLGNIAGFYIGGEFRF
jgi:hypothetical protein